MTDATTESPIMSREDYEHAMAEIERLWESAHTPEYRERFMELVIRCEEYEQYHFPLGEPNQIELPRLPCGHSSRAICGAAMCDGLGTQPELARADRGEHEHDDN